MATTADALTDMTTDDLCPMCFEPLDGDDGTHPFSPHGQCLADLRRAVS